ncbi:MAG: PD40 domain-containing protein, partial [Caldilineaceae bacterium]|nr:PD40 domain-containing protein [Caldilineaceae bacterium]
SIHLFLVDPIADTRVNLSGETSPVEDGAPVWSPDGEWIAFRRNINDGPGATLSKQLWIMRADGSDARPLTDD